MNRDGSRERMGAAPRRVAGRVPRWALVAVASLVVASAACIIPDRGIRSESDDDNPGAVRIVESIPIVPELVAACEADPVTEDDLFDPLGCPQVPKALPQGVIAGTFCSCPGGDGNALAEFELYAEDPDRRGSGPADTLYAVALLDLDPSTDAPQNFVAYPEHLAPGAAGEYLANPVTFPSQGRENNGLWRFRFGKDGGAGVDLCNDNNGQTLSLGLHGLQVMVTDRPFFRPPRLDANGDPVLDPAGRPVLLSPQYGMPDLGIGATWSVANYVFECQDSSVVSSNCACLEEGP